MGEQLQEPEHEGEAYLRLLGFEDIADQQLTVRDYDSPDPDATKTIAGRDFLDVCGTHARPMLVGLSMMDENHPRYHTMRDALRTRIGAYVGIEAKPAE